MEVTSTTTYNPCVTKINKEAKTLEESFSVSTAELSSVTEKAFSLTINGEPQEFDAYEKELLLIIACIIAPRDLYCLSLYYQKNKDKDVTSMNCADNAEFSEQMLALGMNFVEANFYTLAFIVANKYKAQQDRLTDPLDKLVELLSKGDSNA